jgi:hypothetical protein
MHASATTRTTLLIALIGLTLVSPADAIAQSDKSNNGNAYAYGRGDKSNNGNAYAYGRKDDYSFASSDLLRTGAPAPAPGLAFIALSIAAAAMLRRRARK